MAVSGGFSTSALVCVASVSVTFINFNFRGRYVVDLVYFLCFWFVRDFSVVVRWASFPSHASSVLFGAPRCCRGRPFFTIGRAVLRVSSLRAHC